MTRVFESASPDRAWANWSSVDVARFERKGAAPHQEMEGLLAAAASFGARRCTCKCREQATARRLQERRPRSVAERDDRPPEAARGDGDGARPRLESCR